MMWEASSGCRRARRASLSAPSHHSRLRPCGQFFKRASLRATLPRVPSGGGAPGRRVPPSRVSYGPTEGVGRRRSPASLLVFFPSASLRIQRILILDLRLRANSPGAFLPFADHSGVVLLALALADWRIQALPRLPVNIITTVLTTTFPIPPMLATTLPLSRKGGRVDTLRNPPVVFSRDCCVR